MAAPYLTELYGEVNQGAHRKAADNVGAPALVWHQALWNSKHDEDDRSERAKKIESYLKALHARLFVIDKELQPPLEYIQIGSDDRVRVITFIFTWSGLRTKVRFEVHTEYLTITSFIDCSVDVSERLNRTKENMKATYPLYRQLNDDIDKLLDLLESNTALHYDPNDEAQRKLANQLSDAHTPLYRTFWESQFDYPILDFVNEDDPAKRRWLSSGELGRRFADFRGVITCEGCTEQLGVPPARVDLRHIAEQKLQRPFYKTVDAVAREQPHRTYRPASSWARFRLNAAWPFLEAAQERLPAGTEYTVSRPLDGRVLYVSALGPQPMEGIPLPGQARPVFFYIHSITRCERQIGRIIDRLVQLGTLRLAAILPVPALKLIAQSLRDVETQIGDARKLIHDLIDGSNKRSAKYLLAPQRRRLEQNVIDELAEIQDTMADISAGTPVKKIVLPAGTPDFRGVLGDETIDYRLARSRYYRVLFEEQLKRLRIRRLEGYQPYDEFVLRRLEGAFGFIEGIERRIREIKGDWRALDQLYLATSVTILTGEIHEQESAVKEIQTWGELILLCFFTPYYVGMTLTHIRYPLDTVGITARAYGILAHGHFSNLLSGDFARLATAIYTESSAEEATKRILWILAFVIGISFYAYRRWTAPKKSQG